MKQSLSFILLILLIVIFFVLNLLLGTVHIPVPDILTIWLAPPSITGGVEGGSIYSNIIWSSRVPQALTALMAGAGLAVSGLQMQTVFRNPLAGPSVLGISNGASLGVALVVLMSGSLGGVALSRLGYLGDVAMSVAAIAGALAVMGLIVWVNFNHCSTETINNNDITNVKEIIENKENTTYDVLN